jgi:hypothetical protein
MTPYVYNPVAPKMSSAANLSIRKFNMRDIVFNVRENKGPVIILIGRRDTGKSFLIKDLLYYHQSVPICTVISGTEAGNGFYAPLVPKLLIHYEYNTSIIEKILIRQKMVVQEYQRSQNAIDPRTIVILDDCLYDDSWSRDKLMRCIFMNGRHWKIMLIITMQYPLGVPPVLRTNVDYVFILREPYSSNRRRLYENYAGMFPTFDAFNQVMKQCTNNYECLVINNNTKSNELVDQIFWYKASPHPPYRLCSRELWEQSAAVGDTDTEGVAYDPNASRRKSSGVIINVAKQHT